MNGTVKLMTVEDEQKFIELVIDFAQERSMTLSNITSAIEKVVAYMNDNATLGKGTAGNNSSPLES